MSTHSHGTRGLGAIWMRCTSSSHACTWVCPALCGLAHTVPAPAHPDGRSEGILPGVHVLHDVTQLLVLTGKGTGRFQPCQVGGGRQQHALGVREGSAGALVYYWRMPHLAHHPCHDRSMSPWSRAGTRLGSRPGMRGRRAGGQTTRRPRRGGGARATELPPSCQQGPVAARSSGHFSGTSKIGTGPTRLWCLHCTLKRPSPRCAPFAGSAVPERCKWGCDRTRGVYGCRRAIV